MKPHSSGLDIKNMDHVLKIQLLGKIRLRQLILSQNHETSLDLPPSTKAICLQGIKYTQYYNGKDCILW